MYMKNNNEFTYIIWYVNIIIFFPHIFDNL